MHEFLLFSNPIIHSTIRFCSTDNEQEEKTDRKSLGFPTKLLHASVELERIPNNAVRFLFAFVSFLFSLQLAYPIRRWKLAVRFTLSNRFNPFFFFSFVKSHLYFPASFFSSPLLVHSTRNSTVMLLYY